MMEDCSSYHIGGSWKALEAALDSADSVSYPRLCKALGNILIKGSLQL